MDIHFQFKMAKDIVAGLYGNTAEGDREATKVAVAFYIPSSSKGSSFHMLANQMIAMLFHFKHLIRQVMSSF